MEREYISKIVLELQPKSRRCCRYLFGIRENKSFNKETFDKNYFTKCFRNEFNGKGLLPGQYIKCMNLIVAVEYIKRSSTKSSRDTRIELLLRGVPFQNEEEEEKERRTYSPCITISPVTIPSNSSRHCPQCNKCLSDGECLVKTESWSQPAVCLSCYESLYADKCGRCGKPLTFDKNMMRRDGSLTYDYVEVNGSPWHVDCCKCAVCSQPLVGRDCYGNGYDDQLYCYEHCC